MKAFIYTLYLKTKLDIKSTDILITYYLVPLIFFGIMGTVFTSIMPEVKHTIIATMTIFSVTMGALIGTPGSIADYFRNDMRKSFKSAGIPMGTIIISSILSGFVNLVVVSVAVFLISPLAFDAKTPENMVVYITGYILFLIATLLIGILLGLYAKTPSKLPMYSQIVFLPSIMLSGIMFPADMLPKPLEYLGLIFPATHGMKLLSSNDFKTNHCVVLLIFIIAGSIIIQLRLRRLRYEDAR
jgi:ABC-2 type transport system permease protein